jgi:hypothetical protein
MVQYLPFHPRISPAHRPERRALRFTASMTHLSTFTYDLGMLWYTSRDHVTWATRLRVVPCYF